MAAAAHTDVDEAGTCQEHLPKCCGARVKGKCYDERNMMEGKTYLPTKVDSEVGVGKYVKWHT